MKQVFSLIPLFVLAVSCAMNRGTPPIMNNEKEFEVPAKLADQFAVRETDNTPAPIAPAPAPVGEKVDEKNASPQGKVSKDKSEKDSAKIAKKEKPKSAKSAKQEIPNRWSMTPFFRPGERVVFDITYFGATAGQLELEVLPPKVISNRSSYHFRAVATTTSIFSLFYRVHDVAESFMDTDGLFSHKFSLRLDESKQERDVLELYDQEKRKAYYWSKLIHQQRGRINDQSEIELVPFTQDGLSSFFYVRTLPLELGKTYEFPLVNNGKLRTVRVTALRKEELRTKVGTFNTIVVKPEVVLDGVLQSYGDSFLWISDDANREILKIDAKIKVGSVIGYLRERSYASSISASP